MKRIFINHPLDQQEMQVDLYHRLIRVLRYKVNDTIIVFNTTKAMMAKIVAIGKPMVTLLLDEIIETEQEHINEIHLAIAMIKPSRMDFAIEKAAELKVASITPVITEYTQGHLQDKKVHWQKIMISACEQSNNYKVPKMHPAVKLKNYVTQQLGYYAHPYKSKYLSEINITTPCHILIGPEGGFSKKDLILLNRWRPIKLFDNILRTETAVVTALTLIQHKLMS